jgi:hypothetical protein
MSIDAVALLKIPGFTPPDDADVRELDDGFLLFLGVPFESEPEVIVEAIDTVVGDGLFDHAEVRGIFVFPDTAEPDDASTYDAVIEQVGDDGAFISLGGDAIGNPEEVLGQMMEAMGLGSGGELMKALQSGDEDALKMAQIQMMGAMERAMTAPPEGDETPAAEAPPGEAPKLGTTKESESR